MVDLTVEHLHLARPAQPMTARVGQVDAGPERRVEKGLVLLDLDGLAQRLDGEIERHGEISFSCCYRRGP